MDRASPRNTACPEDPEQRDQVGDRVRLRSRCRRSGGSTAGRPTGAAEQAESRGTLAASRAVSSAGAAKTGIRGSIKTQACRTTCVPTRQCAGRHISGPRSSIRGEAYRNEAAEHVSAMARKACAVRHPAAIATATPATPKRESPPRAAGHRFAEQQHGEEGAPHIGAVAFSTAISRRRDTAPSTHKAPKCSRN